MKVLVVQSCPTLYNPTDCIWPVSSVYGILQERILEWVDIPFSRRYSRPRDQTQVSCTAGRFFTIWATREALCLLSSKFSLRLCLIDSLLEFVPFSNPLITLGCQKTGMPSEKETTTFFFPPTKWKGKIVKTSKQKRKRKLIKQHQPKFLKVYWELTVCKN